MGILFDHPEKEVVHHAFIAKWWSSVEGMICSVKNSLFLSLCEGPRMFLGLVKSGGGEEKTKLALFNVPTYPTGIWSFQWGIKGVIEPALVNFSSINDIPFMADLHYYNEAIHSSSFALPNYINKMLSTKVIKSIEYEF